MKEIVSRVHLALKRPRLIEFIKNPIYGLVPQHDYHKMPILLPIMANLTARIQSCQNICPQKTNWIYQNKLCESANQIKNRSEKTDVL